MFDEYAERYDAWYDWPDGRVLLASEVACVRPLLSDYPGPYLEVGVGTGRFAQALGVEYGVDPSTAALQRARRRGIRVALGTGEDLPYSDDAFGGVLMAFTLCFLRDPHTAFAEVARVLAAGGGLVLGLLPKGTPWADSYAQRGADGHRLYGNAHFYTAEEAQDLLERAGFHVASYRSTLFQEPGSELHQEEHPVDGYAPEAGFIAIAAASRVCSP